MKPKYIYRFVRFWCLHGDEDLNLVFRTMTSNPVGSYECLRPCVVSTFSGRFFTMKIEAALKAMP
jgi:hypothetical protein